MIIIAAIGLIILVIFIAMLSSKSNFFIKNVGGACKDQGGKCLAQIGEKCGNEYPIRVITKGCDKDGRENLNEEGPCCIPLK